MIYVIVIFLMVKLIIMIEIKGKWKKQSKNEQTKVKEGKKRKLPVLSLHTSSFMGSFGGLNSSW